MKKKIIIIIAVLLIIAIVLFVGLIFILAQGLGAAIETAGKQVIGDMAEGVVSGLIDGGMEIASDLFYEGVSTILGG